MMSISTESTWKYLHERIVDPILPQSMKNSSLSSLCGESADRFMSETCSLKMLHNLKIDLNNQNQCLNRLQNSQEMKYQEALLNAFVVPKKKKDINKKRKQSYQSKINRNGYLLNSQCYYEKKQQEIRVIDPQPIKIMNAPKLKDDFYTNLIDWGQNDNISVVLDNGAYLWSKRKNETEKLTSGYISCVKWNNKNLILGEETGKMKIFDVQTKSSLIKWRKHEGRIGTIDTHGNQNLIATGSKDKTILIWDIRSKQAINILQGHRQEICGLKWSPDGNYLATGGNDNWVCLWDFRKNKLSHKYSEHTAAVKALAWSPHQNSILATGGGSTDKTIKIWDTNEIKSVKTIETGSQVCNMTYCSNTNELISTHGFSLNSVNVWNGKTMNKIGSLQGHTERVLYLAKSPEEDTIVTGSGDQTMRFWRIYNNNKKNKKVSELEVKNNFLR